MACSGILVLLASQPSVPLIALFAGRVRFGRHWARSTSPPGRPRSRAWSRAERLPAAIALGQLNFQLASVLGPAVAGFLIATIGLPGAYLVDVAVLRGLVPRRSSRSRRCRRSRGRAAGSRRHPRGPPVRAPASGDPRDLRDRPRRDDLRDADVAVPGPRARRLPRRSRRASACWRRRRPSGRCSARCCRAGCRASGGSGLAVIVAVAIWGVAITLFGLSEFSFAARARSSSRSPAPPTSCRRSSAPTIVQLAAPDQLRGRISVDPHPRRDERPADRRHRGGGRRVGHRRRRRR